MIAIFYIGLDRFSDLTRQNHQKLIDAIQTIGPVRVYEFLQPKFDRSQCPVTGSVGAAGGLQTWDFMKAVQLVQEPIVIKLRTDVWFSESSIPLVIEELKAVLQGHQDVSYMGANAQDNFQTSCVKWHTPVHKKVPDFVIIARREKVMDIDRVSNHLAQAGDVANGNKTFKIITANLESSWCVNCYIFLIRNQFTKLDDWNVGFEFYKSYAHGGPAVTWWASQLPRPNSTPKNLAIFYIGADRFPEVGYENHKNLISQISQLIPTKIYYFTHSFAGRGQCPWQESGAIQVWDFMESVNRTSEDIVIKLRSDLWFTPSSEAAVIKELQKILNNTQDASFMGSNWKEYLGHEYTTVPSNESATLQDFVVMARRTTLMPKETVYNRINNLGGGKKACGTKVFKSILQPAAIAFNVFCQIYLVRKSYDQVDPWQVGFDYISSYKKQYKMPDALPWYMSTKK